MSDEKIQTFTDLITWKEGRKLVVDVYKITKTFPRDEIYGIISQMRRAAVSVTSNLTEGLLRNKFIIDLLKKLILHTNY